jgi:hypothetical protein
MASVVVSTLPRRTSSAGQSRAVIGNLAAGLRRVDIRAARYAWPDVGDVIEVLLEISVDNGVTWKPVAGFRAPGGELAAPNDGGIVTHSTLALDLNTSGAKLRTSMIALVDGVDTELETLAEQL